MKRFVVRWLLPTIFCLLPISGGVALALAMPEAAWRFYVGRVRESYLDWLILGLGSSLALIQLVLSWRALRWQDVDFDHRPDDVLQQMAWAAEWFPLLGLFGTVAGILQTFAVIGLRQTVPQQEILRLYAPALTTTASGLLMALVNVVPWWLVVVGRRLILSLALRPARFG
ncbi:MAG: MotA/TolQ/ExbB proton channel family protein [Gemmatales bacterium]|nr:MotA/TolQ/ExbB proton channel family protein [Gemmatales bacterium]MCS7160004.1 MotA/TolQ/ExbB proton channel family protein [Gemmatales bacterium]MDW8175203.1 MotA/TolQ/ExbB proton channel family protein [Gemmatales bacterium]MDW8222981.1 MotA/TolQ/ExbB proton channel family protein [Gemmatales bacterium]